MTEQILVVWNKVESKCKLHIKILMIIKNNSIKIIINKIRYK